MSPTELQKIVQKIVEKTTKLKNKHTDEIDAPVNYVCILSHSKSEFKMLIDSTRKNSKIIKETPTGPIFRIPTLPTISGDLKLLKIRKPDKNKPQLGYADFTIKAFSKFKEKCLLDNTFYSFTRPGHEIIGIKDSDTSVSTYFANPPLDESLKDFL